jgi:hypothetical protein
MCTCILYRCMSFCLSYFGLVLSVLLRVTASDNPFGVFNYVLAVLLILYTCIDVCSYFIYVYWCLLLFAAGVIDMFGHKRYSQFIYGMNLIIWISFFFQITRMFTCYKEYLPVTNPTAQNKTRMESFIFIESMFSRNPCVW